MQSDLKQICDAVAQVLGQEMRAVEFTNTNNGEVYLTFPAKYPSAVAAGHAQALLTSSALSRSSNTSAPSIIAMPGHWHFWSAVARP